ncbi:hypothetical protein BE04_18715 [Sorangium cellulosum]|uniref:Uncharacterized protein n=2 Tax=Sorangium cellulosum TaxID=56 RepID=A0A150Q762_SORCE|nr:hypothetical protein [Sorangium cellulosum]AGP41615.1 hypothetical protein SCE1572_48260 [Sorangium cellulosum So0157-2]KYF63805.1 hypothetical protein BE04_18715 [Sorangium cellulosum]
MAKKLSRHAFTTFWGVHAWAGVVGGLLLHVMFLSGGITLFRRQLAVWASLARGGAGLMARRQTASHG